MDMNRVAGINSVRIPGIDNLRINDTQMDNLKQMAQAKTPLDAPPSTPSFGQTLQNAISDVNSMQVQSDRDIRSVIAGEDVDAHQVMLSVEKANIAFDLVMEVRNKLLDAYREVMKSSF
jgi:flagellar hook-basal body complex protein FliE